MISYIVCRWRRQLFQEVGLPYLEFQRARFGAEVIIVENPRSIFDAYEQGRQQAKYPIIGYIHDDAALLDPNVTLNLVRLFEQNPAVGLVGILGASDNGFLPWWRNLDMFGHYMCRDRSRLTKLLARSGQESARDSYVQNAATYVCAANDGQFMRRSLRISDGILAAWHSLHNDLKWRGIGTVGFVDGMFMVERRVPIPWDTCTYTGWHCYDMDRSLQLRAAGWQVAVCDVLIYHEFQNHNRHWHQNQNENLTKLAKKWHRSMSLSRTLRRGISRAIQSFKYRAGIKKMTVL